MSNESQPDKSAYFKQLLDKGSQEQFDHEVGIMFELEKLSQPEGHIQLEEAQKGQENIQGSGTYDLMKNILQVDSVDMIEDILRRQVSPIEEIAIKLRLGLNGDDPVEVSEIAKRLNISKHRAYQAISGAKRKVARDPRIDYTGSSEGGEYIGPEHLAQYFEPVATPPRSELERKIIDKLTDNYHENLHNVHSRFQIYADRFYLERRLRVERENIQDPCLRGLEFTQTKLTENRIKRRKKVWNVLKLENAPITVQEEITDKITRLEASENRQLDQERTQRAAEYAENEQ